MLVVVSASMWTYVRTLLVISRVRGTVPKVILTTAVYLAVSVVLAGALIYLLRVPAAGGVADSWWFPIVLVAVYACAVAPGFRYVQRRRAQLRVAGFS